MSIVDQILSIKRQETELKKHREDLEAKLAKQFDIELGKSNTKKIYRRY